MRAAGQQHQHPLRGRRVLQGGGPLVIS
jgi:hypothetical protein